MHRYRRRCRRRRCRCRRRYQLLLSRRWSRADHGALPSTRFHSVRAARHCGRTSLPRRTRVPLGAHRHVLCRGRSLRARAPAAPCRTPLVRTVSLPSPTLILLRWGFSRGPGSFHRAMGMCQSLAAGASLRGSARARTRPSRAGPPSRLSSLRNPHSVRVMLWRRLTTGDPIYTLPPARSEERHFLDASRGAAEPNQD